LLGRWSEGGVLPFEIEVAVVPGGIFVNEPLGDVNAAPSIACVAEMAAGNWTSADRSGKVPSRVRGFGSGDGEEARRRGGAGDEE
jgi:hypothetical protein